MKERMQKVKTFVKENKKEILAGVYAGCVGIACCAIGYHQAKKKYFVPDGYITRDEPLKAFLASLDENYPAGTKVHFGMTNQMNTPISANDLGKLGEIFKEAGDTGDGAYTHFLAIGPGLVKD